MTTNLPATPTLLQRLDFHLVDGQRARALLTPVLAADGTRLVHVELDYAAAGSDMFAAIGNQGFSRTAIVAGTLAYRIAERQSETVGGIVEITLDNEAVLHRAEVEGLTFHTIPVVVRGN